MPREPLPGPFLIAVMPSSDVRVVRPPDSLLPRVQTIYDMSAPMVALADGEGEGHYGGQSCSNWAMDNAAKCDIAKRLRRLADFIENGALTPSSDTKAITDRAARELNE